MLEPVERTRDSRYTRASPFKENQRIKNVRPNLTAGDPMMRQNIRDQGNRVRRGLFQIGILSPATAVKDRICRETTSAIGD
ncbi:hypothetical protein GCM10014719_59230 [Planomonospora parontospora subsp. antibiotica]|nr:hypothetical protein GCM10014719_59230 [Planomonospora parontospora subsp. antibiotica]GII19265.1 hypothetical protein Ppa05_59910 [Planomonospora parontospora subsp. antibiotica]